MSAATTAVDRLTAQRLSIDISIFYPGLSDREYSASFGFARQWRIQDFEKGFTKFTRLAVSASS